jgi:general secretion pathway protein J
MANEGVAPDRPDSGFTLIELLIALALFALISIAGLSLIETTVDVQQRTQERSERLAEVQRALFMVAADFEQLTSGPVRDASGITLTRGSADGAVAVSYALRGNALTRSASGTERTVLGDVTQLQWRFYKNAAWTNEPATTDSPDRPRAVELVLAIGRGQPIGAGPDVRRVLELPAE